MVSIRLQGERTAREAELYAVDSTGVIVNMGRVVHLRWPRLEFFDVEHLGEEFDVFSGQTPGTDKQRRLASVSRFPQGLSGELLTRVLAIRKQAAIEEMP